MMMQSQDKLAGKDVSDGVKLDWQALEEVQEILNKRTQHMQ